jgi:aspartate aminotransferase
MADAKPVLVNTLPESNFEPDFEDLEAKINSSIKGVIINSPSNPTGGVWKNELSLNY